ncbi:hypothetical protein WA026_004657 [Henosepilachna vigintioctopunctata]|uniref:Peptidase S1 domain-containing protein n=1 Tax=Henosepilachna vigintioctopunctata TaxID=420089 RepID=A0AAW1VAL3_9CUCU
MVSIRIFLIDLFLLRTIDALLSIQGSSLFHNKQSRIMTMGNENSGDVSTTTYYWETTFTNGPISPTTVIIPSTTQVHILTPSPTMPQPNPTKTPVMPNRNGAAKAIEKCGEYHEWIIKRSTFQYFIIRGSPAISKEFPHMAALGYGPANNIQWLCGGSLISKRYVLTAAHCLRSMEMGVVTWVRLGDNNLTSVNSLTVQMFSVIERISHPDYSPMSKYNDIALLKLDRPVEFSEYVLPICLSTSPFDVNNRLIATGWGKTVVNGPRSNALLKVDLEYFPNGVCSQAYADVSKKDLPEGVLPDKQLCAGSRTDNRDTCQGDSGGPLQINTDKLYLVGITSIGKTCGLPNVPAIYTRVLYFIPWIEQIVWNTDE